MPHGMAGFSCAKSALIERIGDSLDGFAALITGKDFLNQWGSGRVNFQYTVCANLIAEWNIAAITAAFERIFLLPALNLFR